MSTSPNTIFGLDLSAWQAFDAAYAASLDPSRRALLSMTPGSSARIALAQLLAQQGFIIDAEIMAYGSDAFPTMLERQNDGMTWVPNALQPNIGYQLPSQAPNPPYVPYDPSNPPPNSIKVSTNLADYPAYDPPTPITPPVSSPVAGWLGMTADMLDGAMPNLPAGVSPSQVKVYASYAAAANYPEGYLFTLATATNVAPAGKYQFHLMGSDFMNVSQREGVWLLLP